MIKDITIGQFFPGNSLIHRLDPRVKILLTMGYIIALFLANNLQAMAIGALFVALAYGISKIPPKMILKSLKPVMPIIVFTAVLNMFFVDGNVLFQIAFLRITDKGILYSLVMAVRIVCLIAGTTLLTYTTSPIVLTDGIERLLKPFGYVGVPVHELAMMMTIALRFIPTLLEETDKIISAQKARGADMESGSMLDRAKALVPILIPLFVSAFRRADELALAMECRCYRGGDGRTRMKQLKVQPLDFVASAFVLLCILAVVYANGRWPTIY